MMWLEIYYQGLSVRILEIYTDGSSVPNPGKGAWAYCIVDKNKPIHFEAGTVEDSTCNQMEMQAVIEALEYVVNNNLQDCMLYIHTDSQYVQLGVTKWMNKWKTNGWKSANGEVKNVDMWKHINKLNSQLTTHYQWVRGHSGNKWNEFVDKLCSEQQQK